MKSHLKNLVLLLALAMAISCSPKDKELVPVNNVNVTPGVTTDGSATGGSTSGGTAFDPNGQTLVSQGTFKNGVHTASGTAKLYQKGTTYTLVFDSFKVESGPDLRIYLAENNQAKNFIELTELKNTGNFYLTLPDKADVSKQINVLIWCKQFAVLFGSAELTAPTQK